MFIFNFIKKIYYKFLGPLLYGKIKIFNRHNSYEDYLAHQKEKTTDPARIAKWKGKEWDIKVDGFRNLFNRNIDYVKNKKNSICLGARTGQEVYVLRELGLQSIGIDLVPFPPFTVEGDIHNLSYKDEQFDLVFTNILDHSLYLDKFISEMERVCKKNGNIIINIAINNIGDKYSENMINSPEEVEKLFHNSKVVVSKNVKNTFDELNYEIVFEKK